MEGGLSAHEKYQPLWLPKKEKLSVEIVYAIRRLDAGF